MRLRSVMQWVAGVSVLMILAAPIARAYIHGGKTSPSLAQPSRPRVATTTAGWEEARILPLASGAPGAKPLSGAAPSPIPESETFAIVSLGLLALGAASWQRRRRGAPLRRLHVVPSP